LHSVELFQMSDTLCNLPERLGPGVGPAPARPAGWSELV
jgi:hypothetical protein